MRSFILFFCILTTSSFGLVFPSQLQNNEILDRLENVEKVQEDPRKWLFVIGVEDYDSIDNVVYSEASAKTFVKLMQKVVGINERHTYTMIGDHATAGAIKSELANLLNNVKEGDTIYFYYSGHGIPVIPSKEPYLLPKDMTPAIIALEEDFKLQNVYKKLASSKAGKVIAIIDSCFSGATDGKSLFKGVAATRLVAKKVQVNKAKMAIITAGQDKEFSNMYKKKSHRLFSYFVMDAILKGKTDIKSLYQHTLDNVKGISFGLGDQFKQTPMIQGNEKLVF